MSISSTRAVDRVADSRQRCERIQIDDDQIDKADAVRLERREIVRTVAPRGDTAVELRVQGLDPAVEHFGKP